MIRIDRAQLLNGHSFRLGVSGSGKSMSAKEELVEIALRTKDDILILDPESEFGQLVKALGGEVLPISPHSSIHLNALDIDRAYGEGKTPLVDKVKLILSVFEPLTENGLTAKQRSILDRCARLVYREYIRGGYRGAPPTLVDLRRILLEQPEAEAHDLALASELYTIGSLNIFAHQTNVDTGARILCYDIRELDEQLRPVGMVVTLDAIFNRVIRNWRQGKRTWILADEFYILFRYSTRMEEHEETVITTDEDGGEITDTVTVAETILEFEVTHKATAEMAVAYGFTPRQNEQLALLTGQEYTALWMTLLGGYVNSGGQIIEPDTDWVGTGIFAWPLPQSFTITSPFGYRKDPFTGEVTYHSGTDIAAPAGTPILAAAAGMVTIANGTDPWGGSYGYYIKLDHGEGMETLYAHCSAIAVTAGQQVRQGEVIGYVGTTGNSTGNHLHFEMRDAMRQIDAMKYFTIQK